MLVEFRVENHRSLRDEQVLSFEAASGMMFGGESIPRRIDGCASPLLPAAAIFGANASGKTNLLLALSFVAQTVVESASESGHCEGVSRDPFAWGDHRHAPSRYEVAVVLGGCRYRYGFVVDDHAVLEEWLHVGEVDREVTWFERQGQDLAFSEEFRDQAATIRQRTPPNALVLSAAHTIGHEPVRPLGQWFELLGWANWPSGLRSSLGRPLLPPRGAQRHLWTHEINEPLQPDSRTTFLDEVTRILQWADMGIHEVRLDRVHEPPVASPSNTSLEFRFLHEGHPEAWLQLDQESSGTRELFHLVVPLVQALRDGGLLLVDELESSLHPALARQIVELFHNSDTNPKNAQLLFTTHETRLMGRDPEGPVLRPDQVWLTEKSSDGATRLYSLAEYQLQADANPETGYLQGRFGAVPCLTDLDLPVDRE